MSSNVTRAYRSTLRSEQAAETRRRVLEAAAACFSESGYAGTSLAAIADRAGVSTETVKAGGPKRDLLLRAFEQAFSGHEGDAQISDSETGRALTALPDNDAFLAATAQFVAAANARTSTLWTELLAAANTDDVIRQALDDLLARRHSDYDALVTELVSRGIARDNADAQHASAALSFLWSPEGYQQLVVQSGWSVTRYERWLADAVRSHFGAQPEGASRPA